MKISDSCLSVSYLDCDGKKFTSIFRLEWFNNSIDELVSSLRSKSWIVLSMDFVHIWSK